MQDPGTALGAELAGWSYPATVPQLLSIAAIGDKDTFKKIAPWVLDLGGGSNASAEEIAQANAELEDGIVFS